MGVSYSAAIVVGLPRRDLSNLDNLKEILYDDESLEVCAPYYDGDSDDSAIVGVLIYKSPNYAPKEIDLNSNVIAEAQATFKEITGLDAKIWISPRGY